MVRWITRGLSALAFLAAATAYFGIFPADVVGAMDWAISAEVWILNHAAFPGLFMLCAAIGLGLMVPDIWKGVVWIIKGHPKERELSP